MNLVSHFLLLRAPIWEASVSISRLFPFTLGTAMVASRVSVLSDAGCGSYIGNRLNLFSQELKA